MKLTWHGLHVQITSRYSPTLSVTNRSTAKAKEPLRMLPPPLLGCTNLCSSRIFVACHYVHGLCHNSWTVMPAKPYLQTVLAVSFCWLVDFQAFYRTENNILIRTAWMHMKPPAHVTHMDTSRLLSAINPELLPASFPIKLVWTNFNKAPRCIRITWGAQDQHICPANLKWPTRFGTKARGE